MISWLKGQIIKKWHLSSKNGVVLNVGGVGYEVQLLSKQIGSIDKSDLKEFWIHQINREDCTNLYGFNEINQRDLFRKIITVNGIGPQIGMALLEDLEVSQLVFAIEESNFSLLTKSQGVGKRIAERLVVELKSKLQEFNNEKDTLIQNRKSNKSNQLAKYVEEIKSILNSLGYVDNEIKDAIELITTHEKENILLLNSLSVEAKSELMDKHLKKILIRLSEKST
tara:strand:- start:8135 stop:8809 length:675 start_codon:yes stop_codon:yes gene_type:complete